MSEGKDEYIGYNTGGYDLWAVTKEEIQQDNLPGRLKKIDGPIFYIIITGMLVTWINSL